MTLSVTEIFKSIQGESTYSGKICSFVRLSYCNLSCKYCDTLYSKEVGKEITIEEILKRVEKHKTSLVEVTGGEPLYQKNCMPLLKGLLKSKKKVLLETNGSLDISKTPPQVIKIMDIKTPSSGMSRKNRLSNLKYLNKKDEIKFVITDKKDYNFAKRLIKKHLLTGLCTVLFSAEAGNGSLAKLAEWVIKDNLDVRLNLQLHKIIWPNRERGV